MQRHRVHSHWKYFMEIVISVNTIDYAVQNVQYRGQKAMSVANGR